MYVIAAGEAFVKSTHRKLLIATLIILEEGLAVQALEANISTMCSVLEKEAWLVHLRKLEGLSTQRA